MAQYQLTGSVIERTTQQGITALRIEAWGKLGKARKKLATTTTDDAGRFRIQFDLQVPDQSPDPQGVIKVFSGEKLLLTTAEQPIENWTPQQTPVVIEVNMPPGDDQPFSVQGEVVKPDGTPLPGRLVRAYDRALCDWRLLGGDNAVARTNDLGRYHITYDPAQLKQWGKTRARSQGGGLRTQ